MYIAKVQIGDKKIGDEVNENLIGKDNIESYLSKGYIVKAETSKKTKKEK